MESACFARDGIAVRVLNGRVRYTHNTETLTDSGNILFTKHDGKTSIPKTLKLFLANKIFRLYFTIRYEYTLLVCMLFGRFEMRQCLLGSAFPRLEVCNAQRLRYWFSGERTLVGENRSYTLPLNLIRVCVCVLVCMWKIAHMCMRVCGLSGARHASGSAKKGVPNIHSHWQRRVKQPCSNRVDNIYCCRPPRHPAAAAKYTCRPTTKHSLRMGSNPLWYYGYNHMRNMHECLHVVVMCESVWVAHSWLGISDLCRVKFWMCFCFMQHHDCARVWLNRGQRMSCWVSVHDMFFDMLS